MALCGRSKVYESGEGDVDGRLFAKDGGRNFALGEGVDVSVEAEVGRAGGEICEVFVCVGVILALFIGR